MSDYVWSHLERRDLYLGCRLVADDQRDGDWMQWASDTLIYDLEIHNDPRQGVGLWLFESEAQLVDAFGECLWGIVQPDPFSAADLLAEEHPSLRAQAKTLADLLLANGRERS